MEGIIVKIVINRDDRLTIDMTVIEEDSGEYLVATWERLKSAEISMKDRKQ